MLWLRTFHKEFNWDQNQSNYYYGMWSKLYLDSPDKSKSKLEESINESIAREKYIIKPLFLLDFMTGFRTFCKQKLF